MDSSEGSFWIVFPSDDLVGFLVFCRAYIGNAGAEEDFESAEGWFLLEEVFKRGDWLVLELYILDGEAGMDFPSMF